MKKGIRTEIDWGLIGAELAQESDKEQIEFFKSFVKEMESFETKYQSDMQYTYIRSGLTEEERENLGLLS